MIIITAFHLEDKINTPQTFVVKSNETPHCPSCNSILRVIGSRPRILKENDGVKKSLVIRRLYCHQCKQIHHELPDLIVPYKRYSSEAIEKVLASSDNFNDFPGETSTATRIQLWFLQFRQYFKKCLQSLIFLFQNNDRTSKEILAILPLHPVLLAFGWLKLLVRYIGNFFRWPQTRSA